MGILRDIFEEKIKIWENPDEETYNAHCQTLRSAGVKIQAFVVNQNRPKCTGNCASCSALNAKEDEKLGYKKLGRGCSDDLLEAKLPFDLYAIYVKKSDVQKAMKLLGITELPDDSLNEKNGCSPMNMDAYREDSLP